MSPTNGAVYQSDRESYPSLLSLKSSPFKNVRTPREIFAGHGPARHPASRRARHTCAKCGRRPKHQLRACENLAGHETLREAQLRGHSDRLAGKRAVRTRERRIHRSDRTTHWPVRSGRRWHDFSGRNWRNTPRTADQAAPRAARKRVRALGKLAHTPDRRPLDCRDEPGFGNDGERAEVPIGSLFPRECLSCPRPALAGTAGGYSTAGAALRTAVFQTYEKSYRNDSVCGNGCPVPIPMAGKHKRTSECDRAGR